MEQLLPEDKKILQTIPSTQVEFSNIVQRYTIALNVEICVYNADVDVLLDIYNITYSEAYTNNFMTIDGNTVTAYSENVLHHYKYEAGTYKVNYKLYRNLVGNHKDSDKLLIKEISPSRFEILVQYVNDDQKSQFLKFTEDYFYKNSVEFDFTKYANLNDDTLLLILNSKNITQSDGTNALVLKLYEPLADTVSSNTKLWLVKVYGSEILTKVAILPSEEDLLKGTHQLLPDFTTRALHVNDGQYTPYKSYNTLTSSSLSSSNLQLYSKLGQVPSADLNIDYSDFYNFVHFGSAFKVFENVQKKVEAIELYNALLRTAYAYTSSLISVLNLTNSGSMISSSINDWTISGTDVKNLNISSGSVTYTIAIDTPSTTNYISNITSSDVYGGLGTLVSGSKLIYVNTSSWSVANATNAFLIVQDFSSNITPKLVSGSLVITSSLAVASASIVTTYSNKLREIFSNFTNYENFVYNKSSSYFTSLVPYDSKYNVYPYTSISYEYNGYMAIDATWPKVGTTYPYVLAQSTDAVTMAWYELMQSASFEFDYNNKDNLINTLPAYILNDADTNSDYISFIYMMGEHFDILWQYIYHYYRINSPENLLTDSVPNGLLWNILKNKGTELSNGNSLIDITRYYSGTYTSASLVKKLDKEDNEITNEISNRILNNIPFLYKSRGTQKSIYGLLNSYGIPRDLIVIREFGGGSSQTTASQDREFYSNDFTHTLDFTTGSNYLAIPWNTGSIGRVPDSIEFKFKADDRNLPYTILSKTGSYSMDLALSRKHSKTDLGKLTFAFYSSSVMQQFLTSSYIPFYNGEFYNVLLKRSIESDDSGSQTYTMAVKKYDELLNKIVISDIQSVYTSNTASWNTPGTMYVGGRGTFPFYGSMDEFRLWDESIFCGETDDNIFEWHAQYSTATNGNYLTSSLSTLRLRLDFNDAYSLTDTPTIANKAFNTSYVSQISASGFETVVGYPYNYSSYNRTNTVVLPFLSPSGQNSNKIRLVDNIISQSININSLSAIGVKPLRFPYNSNRENKIFDDSSNSYVPIVGETEVGTTTLHSDKIIIGFAPSELINQDIIAFYGKYDIMGAIADPRYRYENSYPLLNNLRAVYSSNTQQIIDPYEYITYLKLYDKSIFDYLRTYLPIQSTPVIAIVYEPTLLNRNKFSSIVSDTLGYNYFQSKAFLSQRIDDSQFSGNVYFIDAPITPLVLSRTFASVENKDASIRIPDISHVTSDINSNTTDINIIRNTTISSTVNNMDSSITAFDNSNVVSEISSKDAQVLASNLSILSDTLLLNTEYNYKFNRDGLKDTYVYVSDTSTNVRLISSLYSGTQTTSADIPDGKPVIELYKNSALKLKVNYSDNPRLDSSR